MDMEKIEGKICEISGPMVVAKGMKGAKMYATALVGEDGLIGEIIRVEGERVAIQVYEDTTGLHLGEKIVTHGKPLTVELGPGLLGGIFDGIQRPLAAMMEKGGDFIKRGTHLKPLDRGQKWKFIPEVKSGEKVEGGDTIGTVKETSEIIHKILVPQGSGGVVEDIREGEFKVEDEVAVINGKKINMITEWSVRKPRPCKKKLPPDTPFVTGQRIFDFLLPVAAREASMFTGITIAEYYRDMGYSVALMADSTSRWGEALREISSRMEEMPGEEGYPPYLATRLGNFYERAGRVKCLGNQNRTGSVTIISAVSPPGGDFSEPVTQASLRVAGTLWALDTDLAYRR